MAKPATTHVIEIESGIGEPAFIPLTLGQELQPISVGKKGMWRIEGARVLDVHAFVYFDGAALFLQSADESSAAMVDGYRVGKAWTELHAPCRIEVGAARLRFRSLIDAPHPADAEQATVAVNQPPVQGMPGQPFTQQSAGVAPPARPPSAPPPGTQKHPQAPPRPAAGEPPMTFPKPERPFAPGALASKRDDDESTRVAPLESTGASQAVRVPGMSGAINAVAPPRPAAGRPVDEDVDLSTRPEAARAAKPAHIAGATGPFQAMSMAATHPQMGGPVPVGATPSGSLPPVMVQPPMVQGVMAIGTPHAMPPGGYPQQPQQPNYPPAGGYGQMSMPPGMPPQMGGPSMPPGNSGAYTAMPSGAMNAMGMMTPPPGMMPQGGPQQQQPNPGGLQPIAEVWKDPAQRKKILAFVVVLLGGAFLLFGDDDEAPTAPKKQTAADAGFDAPALTAASTSAGPLVPPAPACPPGFQPYGEVKAGQPTTCVPMQPTEPQPTGGGAVATSTKDAGTDKKDAGAAKQPTAMANQKTLERQAVDYVAIGEYQKAIGIYEQLSRQFPDNKVYTEALRILRQKLDAGAP